MKATAIALALALGLATGAQAATFNIGAVGDGSVFPLFDSGLHGLFTDTYTFTTTAMNEINPVAQINLTSKSNITGFTMSLYDNGSLIAQSNGNTPFIDMISGAGSYSLVLTGTGGLTHGGSYGGSVSISAVPEPTESALMLSGIAMIGFIASRRSKKAA